GPAGRLRQRDDRPAHRQPGAGAGQLAVRLGTGRGAARLRHRRARSVQSRTRAGARLQHEGLSMGGRALNLFCVLVFLFLLAPVVVVLIISFSSANYLQFPPPGLSLRWYDNYLSDPRWTNATRVSVEVAVTVTILATLLGTSGALALNRWHFPGRQVLYSFLI